MNNIIHRQDPNDIKHPGLIRKTEDKHYRVLYQQRTIPESDLPQLQSDLDFYLAEEEELYF